MEMQWLIYSISQQLYSKSPSSTITQTNLYVSLVRKERGESVMSIDRLTRLIPEGCFVGDEIFGVCWIRGGVANTC